MKLAWQPYGARTTPSIEVPPLPSLIDWYALDYDPHGKRVLYACRVDDDQRGAELHAFDGTAWTKLNDQRIETGDDKINGGGYDTARRGFVIWGCPFDYTARCHRVTGTLVTASGAASPIETTGDAPLTEPEKSDDKVGTFDKHAAFAFDPGRQTWACLTRRGVWELDARGVWAQKSDGKPVPQEWHGKTGDGFYDPVGKRVVFWMQGRDGGYPLVLLTWDGDRLEPLPGNGLPDLHVGLMNLGAQVGPHHEHGIVVHHGGELYARLSSGWRALGATANRPVKLENALIACDLERRTLMIGPGKHQGAGGSNRHRVFYVLRDHTWEQQGRLVSEAPLKAGAYGNCRMAHAGGSWYATSTHSLLTWKYDGEEWKEIVDKKTGEQLVPWDLLDLVGGDRLHAVSKDGSVHVLDGEQWNRLCKPSKDFKERSDFVADVMPDQRLVVWGGENPRKLNDTLFFENKGWRAAKKASPKPEDFKHGRKDDCYVGMTAVYDTAIGALVRFGYEEVAVLGPDEIWTLHTPKDYKSLISERSYGHVAVHDPDTGETLLVDFAGDKQIADAPARLIRFDLAKCELLATIEYPAALARKQRHDAAPYHALAETYSYDPTTKALYAQVLDDSAGTYRLELGPAFVEAKSRGPRTVPAMKPAKATKKK
jgi:hypothetical protein